VQYIGLLTDQQKRAGYFVGQDEDFIYLWHRRNGNPDIIAIFLYDTATIKQIREAATKGLVEMNKTVKIPEVNPPPWFNKRDKMLSIRLTEVELELLRVKAEEKGFGISTLVRSLIKEFLQQNVLLKGS